MRSLVAILALVLAAPAPAGEASEDFEPALRELEAVQGELGKSGASSAVLAAVERLAATGDVRAVGPLARLLEAALRRQDELRGRIQELQAKGAAAMERMKALNAVIARLELRERAGATGVGPEILQSKDELKAKEREFEAVVAEVQDQDRALQSLDRLREVVVNACPALLAAAEPEAAARGIVDVRAALDVVDAQESLLLVEILRRSRTPAAAEHFVDILANPDAPAPTVRAAIFALAPLKTAAGAREIIRVWEQDPQGMGRYAAAALSLASGRALESPVQAGEWVASLEDEAAVARDAQRQPEDGR